MKLFLTFSFDSTTYLEVDSIPKTHSGKCDKQEWSELSKTTNDSNEYPNLKHNAWAFKILSLLAKGPMESSAQNNHNNNEQQIEN